MSKKAKLSIYNKEIELDILTPTKGQEVVDIRSLSKYGYLTFDPGYMSTASCESTITYIDGDEGILEHRGYPIEEIATKSNYLELCYLLIYKRLPNKKEFFCFSKTVGQHTLLNEQMVSFFKGFNRDAHPMAILCGVVGAMSAFYHDNFNFNEKKQREIAVYRLLSKMPTIVAMCYKYNIGQPFNYPKNNLSYSQNFLYMMFNTPCAEYKTNKILADAMETIFILHADHEQNASTSTVRLAGSTGANPFACIAAGIASLWGPSHGGANEAALNMLEEIESLENIDKYIEKAKDKKDPFKLMGFGHRVYKNYDPRATVMRETCHRVLKELNIKDPLLDVALKLEHIALNDDYFKEKKLYPNVDFYSGIILNAIGIPKNMFTAIFAMSRTIGWCANWLEMYESLDNKIGRPRQLYTGEKTRDFDSENKSK